MTTQGTTIQIPPPTSTCPHDEFITRTVVNRYSVDNLETGRPSLMFTLEVQVTCGKCHTDFRVSNETTIPGHEEPGAYLSPEGTLLEIPLQPVEPVN